MWLMFVWNLDTICACRGKTVKPVSAAREQGANLERSDPAPILVKAPCLT